MTSSSTGAVLTCKHLNRAKRGKQRHGVRYFARELESWRAVLLEHDHDGVRLDGHQAVQRMRLTGEAFIPSAGSSAGARLGAPGVVDGCRSATDPTEQ